MPSSATPILKLEDQATGENAATWGTKTDNNLELVEQAIKSVYSYSCAATGDLTLDPDAPLVIMTTEIFQKRSRLRWVRISA